MKIGCLGDIVFEVSDAVIKTISSATWSGSASIHTHQRHLTNSLQEFVGIDPDEFTFSMTLSKYLGVEPLKDIETIFEYERGGVAVPLFVGTKAYGKDRWLIKSHTVKMESYDGQGNLTVATVDVVLTEYVGE